MIVVGHISNRIWNNGMEQMRGVVIVVMSVNIQETNRKLEHNASGMLASCEGI